MNKTVSYSSFSKSFSLALLPVIYSSLLLLYCYPFFGSADGWTRWQTAVLWADEIGAKYWYWTDLFPPLMSILMGISRNISGEYGYYTFMQIFLVCYAASIVIWNSLKSSRLEIKTIAYFSCFSCLFLIPVTINRIAQIFPEALLAVGLLLLAYICCCYKRLHYVELGGLYLLTIILTIGMRYNALIITVPVLFCVSLLKGFKDSRGFFAVLALLAITAVSSVLVFRLPTYLKMEKSHNLTYILVWDYVGTALKTNNPESNYKLNELIEFHDAKRKYASNTLNNFQWAKGRIQKNNLIAHRGAIFKNYIKLVLFHPLAFIELRTERALGLITLSYIPPSGGPYSLSEYSDWGDGTPVDINFRPINYSLTNLIYKLAGSSAHHWLFRPPFLFGLVIILIAALLKLKENCRYEITVIVIGCAYYLTFIIITPEITYRYFYTTFFLLTLVISISLHKLAIIPGRTRERAISRN